jgi:hypothetical protein
MSRADIQFRGDNMDNMSSSLANARLDLERITSEIAEAAQAGDQRLLEEKIWEWHAAQKAVQHAVRVAG